VIRDGEFVLNESVAIIAYLDKKSPEPALFGRNAQQTGNIWRAILEFQNHLLPSLREHVVRPIYNGKVEENRHSIEEHMVEVQQELASYEATLGKQPWLVGSTVSAADLVIFPFFMSLMRAATRPAAETLKLGMLPLDKTYPHIAAWVGRVEALPGYDKTYPPHWR
jgi:glutathione S-transferase